MLLKGLMGIEYVAIIGIFLLILTAASLQSVENGPGEVVNGGTGITDGYCGDGTCDPGESCSSCPGDCEPCSGEEPTGNGGVPAEQERTFTTIEERKLAIATIPEDKTTTLLEKIKGTVTIKPPSGAFTVVPGETFIIPLKIENIQNVPAARLEIVTAESQQGSIEIHSIPITGQPAATIATKMSKEHDRVVAEIFEIRTTFTNPAVLKLVFTVSNDFFEKSGTQPQDLVVTRINEQYDIEGHTPTEMIERVVNVQGETAAYFYKANLKEHLSLFVINAQFKGPSLCNNNEVCEPPETLATCPLDCAQESPPEQTCEGEETRCFGQVLYRCVSGELLKAGVCEFGCSGGACLEEPATTSFTNTLYGVLIFVTIIIGLAVALLFLRR